MSIQKHKIGVRKKKLRMQIERVRKTRALHRQGRTRGNVPVVAVIGYTNAGKSTLVSKLTKKELEQDDLLFKTLDPALRRLVLPSGKVHINIFAILGETGFILSGLDSHGWLQKQNETIVSQRCFRCQGSAFSASGNKVQNFIQHLR